MSAPSGKSIDPLERSALDQPLVENDKEAARLLVLAKIAENLAAGETKVDADLQRLGSNRERAVGRLPRAVPLPPVSGLRPVVAEGPRAREEQFINGIRVPPSLAPDHLRPPMGEWRDNLPVLLGILLASAIAMPIGYYFLIGGFAPTSEPARVASIAPQLVTTTKFPVPKEGVRSSEAEDDNTVLRSRNKLLDGKVNSPEGVTSPVTETPAASPPSPPPAPDVLAGAVVRQLDPDSIKLLMQQGAQLVMSGDVVSARLVFRRAAEGGNAAAALALGATYDPVWLAKLGKRGVGTDIEKARGWYEKAKEFGSPEASHLLEMLANRQ